MADDGTTGGAKGAGGTAIPSWIKDPLSWEVLTLGGVTLPGLCRSKFKPNRRIDKSQASGKKGAAIVDKGPGLADVTIDWLFWEDQHWNDVVATVPKIYPTSKMASPVALAIAHPIAAVFGIASIYISEIEAGDPDELGACLWKIKAYEYGKPAKTKVKKIDKSQTGPAFGPPAPPRDRKGNLLDDAIDVMNRRRVARGAAPVDVSDYVPQRGRRTSAPSESGATGNPGGAGGAPGSPSAGSGGAGGAPVPPGSNNAGTDGGAGGSGGSGPADPAENGAI